MKRLLSVIVLVCYMVSAIGLSCSLHYCGKHFREICFTDDTEKNCCGKHEQPGCCHDDVIKVKVSDNHAPSHFSFAQQDWQAIASPIIYYYEGTNFQATEITLSLYACDPSPPGYGPPAYILYRNLRI